MPASGVSSDTRRAAGAVASGVAGACGRGLSGRSSVTRKKLYHALLTATDPPSRRDCSRLVGTPVSRTAAPPARRRLPETASQRPASASDRAIHPSVLVLF